MAIYIKQGSALIEMTEQPYDAESVLQQLLADHPNLLGGESDAGQRKRWLLVQREMGIGEEPDAASRWSLDHLFLDEEGVPTLVEVKRSSDTRIRREVVGQMLDYAANAASYWAVEGIRNAFETTRRASGHDPDEELAAHLGAEGDPEAFWQEVATNLRAGRLRLVFVADVIPRELRRVVEFLNAQMTTTDVLAVEVRQYRAPGTDMITLVPRLIGATEAARDTKRVVAGRSARTKNRWNEADLLKAIRETTPGPHGQRMIALYEFMRERGARASWGTGGAPSVLMWLGERDDDRSNPVAISVHPHSIGIYFDFVRGRRTPREMQHLADAMRTVPGVASYFEGLEQNNFGMRPGMRPTDVLADDDALEAWKRALDEAAAPA